MKKLFGSLVVALAMLIFLAGPANAGVFGDDINSGIIGDKNHHNTINSGEITYQGGDATAYGGDACAVGIGVGGDGGNATIERGAINNKNTNTNFNTNLNKVDVDNTNVNVNKVDVDNRDYNANFNANHQSQGQFQDQKQHQSMGSQENVQNTDITVEGDSYTQVYNEAENKRPHANGVVTNFAPVPIYVGPDAQGPTHQDLTDVIKMKSVWQRFEVAPSVNDTDIVFRCRYFLKRPDATKKPTDEVVILTERPQGMFKLVAHATLWSDDTYTTSFELMMKACLLAMDLPTADAVLITGQGCEKFVKSTGWGIGFNHTTAAMSGSQDTSNVSSGGTGYSSGEAGNKGKPWIQVMVLDYK